MFAPVVREFRFMVNSTVACTRLGMCTDYRYIVDSDAAFAKRVLYNKPVKHRPPPLNVSTPLKVLVFSDPHIDFDYEEVSALGNR